MSTGSSASVVVAKSANQEFVIISDLLDDPRRRVVRIKVGSTFVFVDQPSKVDTPQVDKLELLLEGSSILNEAIRLLSSDTSITPGATCSKGH